MPSQLTRQSTASKGQSNWAGETLDLLAQGIPAQIAENDRGDDKPNIHRFAVAAKWHPRRHVEPKHDQQQNRDGKRRKHKAFGIEAFP